MIIWYAGVVTLVLAIAIFLITFVVISRARTSEPAESVVPRLYKIRGRYFLVLMVVLITVLAVTLPKSPYRSLVAAEPAYVVPVSGRIWSWEIGPVLDRDGVRLQADGEELVLPLGQAVEFHVTAMDVNHGFGIYDETGTLVAQTQAMPGYVNELVHTFTKPGTYQVLCMEYCGLAHHSMLNSIRVE